MERQWKIGELAECSCQPAPLGTEPAGVIRGGKAPTLRRGELEHTCPTAKLVRRRSGRPPISFAGVPRAVLNVVLTGEEKRQVVAAAGGAGKASAWARQRLLAALQAPEGMASSAPAQRRSKVEVAVREALSARYPGADIRVLGCSAVVADVDKVQELCRVVVASAGYAVNGCEVGLTMWAARWASTELYAWLTAAEDFGVILERASWRCACGAVGVDVLCENCGAFRP